MPIRPVTDSELERLAVAVSRKTGHTLIDPRFAPEHVLEVTKDFVIEQQHWLDMYCISRLQTERILFGVSSEVRPQAYALFDDSTYFIILSIGLVIRLLGYFSTLLCHPSVFTDIGNAEGEY